MGKDLGLVIGECYVLHTPLTFGDIYGVKGKVTVREAFYQGENHGRLSFDVPSIGKNGVTLTAGNKMLIKHTNGEIYLQGSPNVDWSRKEMAA